MYKGTRYPILLGLVMLLLSIWMQYTQLPAVRQFIDRIDGIIYDFRLRTFLVDDAKDPRIVIVDIDERSLRSEGQWPWPRERIATLVDNLFKSYEVSVVGFDFVFAEEERNIIAETLRKFEKERVASSTLDDLRKRIRQFDNNRIMADALRGQPVVIGYMFNHRDNEPAVGLLPAPLTTSADGLAERIIVPEGMSYTAPIAILTENSAGTGYFSVLPDEDGNIRRASLVTKYQGRFYPSLALETTRVFLDEQVDIHVAEEGPQHVVEAITLGNLVVATDRQARVLIPYIGEAKSFTYVSATDVINGTADAELLAGTIVLVGTTAGGLFDLRSTPVGSVYPGVEVHANIIAGILDGQFPAEPSWAQGFNFVLMMVMGVGLTLLLPRLSPVLLVTIPVAVGALLISGNFYAWAGYGLSLPVATAFFLLVSISVINMSWGFFFESRSRNQLKGMFGQYVPPQLVEEMSHRPDLYSFDGESKELSVLFCDIRSFTTISESLSAHALKDLLNRYFTPMTEIIFNHRGTIDKYVGDMIMAFWGAPVQDEHHAKHAVEAAMAMLAKTAVLKEEFKALGLPEIRIGAGINTGIMNVGDMGSEFRRSYTVLGDAVNLGSRLEGSSKFYGVDLVVGEQTYKQTCTDFLYRELDLVKVKGKHEAIQIYEPIAAMAQVTREQTEEIALHQQGIVAYRQRNWAEARALFESLQTLNPACYLYRLYLERVALLEQNDPGSEWDGVYTHTSK